jgi:hypothetical protein
MLNPELVKAIQGEIALAREEGMDEEDIKWMATGAGVRLAREAGVIGDELPPEMNAAIHAVVEQELKRGS